MNRDPRLSNPTRPFFFPFVSRLLSRLYAFAQEFRIFFKDIRVSAIFGVWGGSVEFMLMSVLMFWEEDYWFSNS